MAVSMTSLLGACARAATPMATAWTLPGALRACTPSSAQRLPFLSHSPTCRCHGCTAAAAPTAASASPQARLSPRAYSTTSHTTPNSPGATQGGGELHLTVEPLAEQHEGVSVVTLCRSSARNAIGRQLLRELVEAVNLLRQERTTRCVVLRSAVPGVFSAGADLKERAGMTQTETVEFVTTLRRAFSDVQALPMPTVAAIEGFALGGGAELALAADIRVASQSAVFAFPEAQLGIIPGAGGTQRLPRLVGPSRAKELIFTARRVTGVEAAEIGLVDHVTPDGTAYKRALELAADIAKCAPLSLRMAKAAINHGLDVDLGTGLRMEEAYYAQLVPTKDRLEGLKAFAEKRPPKYRGE